MKKVRFLKRNKTRVRQYYKMVGGKSSSVFVMRYAGTGEALDKVILECSKDYNMEKVI